MDHILKIYHSQEMLRISLCRLEMLFILIVASVYCKIKLYVFILFNENSSLFFVLLFRIGYMCMQNQVFCYKFLKCEKSWLEFLLNFHFLLLCLYFFFLSSALSLVMETKKKNKIVKLSLFFFSSADIDRNSVANFEKYRDKSQGKAFQPRNK